MIVRADRGRPPGTTVGLIGTVLVHAGAAAFVFTQVQAGQGGPALLRGRAGGGAGAHPQAAARARGGAHAAAGGEAGAGEAAAQAQAGQAAPPPTPKPPPTETKREPPPTTAAPVTPAPGETPSTGTDVATIKTPGLQFPLSGVSAEHRDPGLPQLGPRVRPGRTASPRSAFSFCGTARCATSGSSPGRAASASTWARQGAIEAAGNARGFGPLPDGWDADVLPVSFYFKPISR